MRVGIITYGLDRPLTGIGRSTLELILALDRKRPDIRLVLLNPFGKDALGLGERFETARLPFCRRLPMLLTLGNLAVARAAREKALDLVHDPTGVSPFLWGKDQAPYKRVLTVHDLIPLTHPEVHTWFTNFVFRVWIPATLKKVDGFITVSQSSRQDLERLWAVSPEKIRVIYPGKGEQFRPIPDPQAIRAAIRGYGVREPYILYVGTNEARKNLDRLLAAFAQIVDAFPQHQLVVAGPKKWKATNLPGIIQQLGLEGKVRVTGYVSEEHLPHLYSGAALFVFPSLYEGFGLPPVEAMACGTPVLSSAAAPLAEIGGEAVITVDPYDVGALARGMYRLLTDLPLRSEMRRRGLERAQAFDWDKTAEATATFYDEVVTGA